MINFSQLPQIIDGKIIELSEDLPVEILLTDSRKIISPAHAVFFAIKGERHDGHQYLGDAYQAGLRQFVVEKYSPKMGLYTDANFIEVKSSIKALQKLAAFKRMQVDIPVLAITGSNGKTIIKEWLYYLLQPDYNIIKSPKSYNSQIGVPLSVWPINSSYKLGIFEAGVSFPGEMENLEKVIRPTIGIFTNIGPAHDEGFENLTHKIREKLKLFDNVSLLFYCKDHEAIDVEIRKKNIKTFTWSYSQHADLNAEIAGNTETHTNLKLKQTLTGNIFEINIPFTDAASIENLIHCITVMLYFKIPAEDIQKKVSSLKKVPMRLELKHGINNCYIIDDTYNNDLAGLMIALDFLKQQHQKPNRTVILSDMYETGIDEKDLYSKIGSILVDKGITRFFGIGASISANRQFFPMESFFYLSTKNFLNAIRTLSFSNELILIKGSRVFEFERIVKLLQQKSHRTVLEINLDALAHNLNFYKSKLNPDTKIMVMVKSFAYGSGSLEVAQLLQFNRVDYLAVAYADEGVLLRENGIYVPIMVMSPAEETFDALIRSNLEPVVYSLAFLQKLEEYLSEQQATVKIHLEIETGMHRLGIVEHEVEEICRLLKKSQRIKVASIYSHLAGADDDQFTEYSSAQYDTLVKIAAMLETELSYTTLKHLLNSAGIIRFPQYQLNMVRLGIGLYGVEGNSLLQDSLETVSTLKTTVLQVKKVKKGETVGYGRRGKAERDTTIAIIAIGYGDGYNRLFSNGVGKVWVNGSLAPVMGTVCMDMTMIDITGLDVQEGDEVIIFGKEQSIASLAHSINTIPYEILTSISERVKRVFYMA